MPAPEASSSAAAADGAGGGSEARLSGSHRHIAELLLEQIEVADVLLLNKADTVSRDELTLLQVGGMLVLCECQQWEWESAVWVGVGGGMAKGRMGVIYCRSTCCEQQ